MTTKTTPPISVIQLLKKILPYRVLKLRQEYLSKKLRENYKDLSTQQIFTKIYEEGVWGKSTDPKQMYFSGSGSHNPLIVGTYINVIEKFLTSFEKKPSVVDLGCGDFSVGSKVRQLCDKYTACDIVEPVINFNMERYKDLNVVFWVLDITKDELPDGDIVFIRQVFQHLSNEQISAVLTQIISKYKYLVLTEQLPLSAPFIHNLDKPAGPDTRIGLNSGLVLTSTPFNLQVKENICLCEVPEYGEIIRTNVYRLA